MDPAELAIVAFMRILEALQQEQLDASDRQTQEAARELAAASDRRQGGKA